MNRLAIFAVLIAVCGVAKATHSDCGSTVGEIKSIEISGCDDSQEKCDLRRNTNVTFKLTFTLTKNVQSVKAIVHGEVLDVFVPFALPNSDGCTDSGLTCPLTAGQTYSYETSLPILKKYPRLSVVVKWELKDENDADIVCVLIPSRLT